MKNMPFANAAKIPAKSIYAKETGKRIFPIHEIIHNKIAVLLIGSPVRKVDFGIKEIHLLINNYDGSYTPVKF